MKLSSLLGISALLAALSLTAACSESTNEHHESYFLPNTPNGRILYADQSVDSLYFVSVDSWKLTEAFHNTTPWFTATPKEVNIPAHSIGRARIDIQTTPNTTGETRYGDLRIVTTFAKFGTFSMPVRQVAWLDIASPLPHFAQGAKTPTYTTEITPQGGKVRLYFRLYDEDNATHSLTSDAAWMVIPAANATPAAGITDLTLDIPQNPSTEARTATLTLTSAGITAKMTYTQAGKK